MGQKVPKRHRTVKLGFKRDLVVGKSGPRGVKQPRLYVLTLFGGTPVPPRSFSRSRASLRARYRSRERQGKPGSYSPSSG